MKEDILLRLIEKLLNSEGEGESQKNEPCGLEGSMVIVRCRDAGVHYGRLKSFNGRIVHLDEARRMWKWHASKQMTLSAVAEFGLNLKKDLKIQNTLPQIILLDACEIIPCSEICINSFEKVEPYDAQ